MNQNLTLKQSKSKSWLTQIKLFDRANIKKANNYIGWLHLNGNRRDFTIY